MKWYEKEDVGLIERDLHELKLLEEEQEAINKSDSDCDGEMHRSLRISEMISNIIRYAKNRKALKDRNIVFDEIPGGFIIQSPLITHRRFYFYPNSNKWRQEGKSIYYRCKNINDLLDRFILDISYKKSSSNAKKTINKTKRK